MSLVDAIKGLQKELGVTVDGKWGPKTEAALESALRVKPEAVFSGLLNERSRKNLESCHADLIRIAEEATKECAFTVVCGHRNKADQDAAVKGGYSKLPWPKSKHNKTPSLAFDAYPHPINPRSHAGFSEMRAALQRAADRLGIKVRFISWDLPHVELV